MSEDYRSFNPVKVYGGLYDQINVQKSILASNQKNADSLQGLIIQKKANTEELHKQNNMLGISFFIVVLVVLIVKYMKFKI
jgi:hypothetical protein